MTRHEVVKELACDPIIEIVYERDDYETHGRYSDGEESCLQPVAARIAMSDGSVVDLTAEQIAALPDVKRAMEETLELPSKEDQS